MNVVDARYFPNIEQFSYIDLSFTEMYKGYFGYYCTSKVIEMRLENIKGYFYLLAGITEII